MKSPAPSRAEYIEEASRMTKEELEQRIREKKTALATARGTIKSYREKLEKLKNQPEVLQTEVADQKAELEELDKVLKKETPPMSPEN